MKTQNHTRTLLAGLLSLALAAPLLAAELTRAEKSFIKDAYEGNLAEIQMGELAKSKATKPEAKQLAERMVADHQKAGEELKQVAQSKGVELPQEPDGKHRSKLNMLQGKQGEEFDKAFADQAMQDHMKHIKMFEDASKDVKDPDVKAFIDKTLPTLREHHSLSGKAGGSHEKNQ